MSQTIARSQLLCAAVLFLVAQAIGQNVTNDGTDEIVRRAAEQRRVYLATFKNLISRETKTIHIFGSDGTVKKQRAIHSNFLVYQLATDPDKITEYRNVYLVDGREITGTQGRAEELFTKIAGAGSAVKEIEKIRDESLRYDEGLLISNLTLFQSIALSDPLIPHFSFALAGRETVYGREAFVVSFSQRTPSPLVSVGSSFGDESGGVRYDVDLDGLSNVEERLVGTFWIDTKTFQLIRERRLLTVRPAGFHAPVTLSETWFHFDTSEFGILTPKRISHLQFDIDKKRRSTVKDVEVVLQYERFTRPDVDVKASDVKTH